MVLVSHPKKRSVPAQNKRRHGQHHKKDNRYLKPYWPYIPMVLVIFVGLLFSSMWSHMQHGVLGYATDMSSSGLLQGTNNQRVSNGLGSLALNGQLSSAAQSKANDMVARDYWSHNTPDGKTPWTFITAAGYSYATAGENLAYGFDSSDATITAWMNSPEHRANILNSSYTEVGFGFANSANYQGTGPETVVVAMYASPQAAPAPAPTPAATKPAASKPVSTPATTQQETPVATPSDTPTQPTTDTANKPKDTNVTAVGASKPANANKTIAAKNVSRIQLLTNGNAPWSMFAISVIATVAVVVFFLRHGLFWHRAVVHGEAFVMHHKFLDITLVIVAVLGFILTRSAGVIH